MAKMSTTEMYLKIAMAGETLEPTVSVAELLAMEAKQAEDVDNNAILRIVMQNDTAVAEYAGALQKEAADVITCIAASKMGFISVLNG